MSKQHDLSLNLRYIGMQIPYWMGYSVLMTFASVFLLARNFTNSQIGIILALANLLAVLFQPFVASFADRTNRLTLSQLTIGIALIMVILTILLIFLPSLFLPTAIIYILLATCLMVSQPLTISLGTFFISRGYPLNFGLARGTGSLSFAVASSLVGILTDRFSANVILYIVFIVLLLYIGAVLTLDTRKTGGKYSLPSPEAPVKTASDEKQPAGEPCSLPVFFLTYKKFMLLLVGISLLFIYHNILNTYMFQIMQSLGGTTADMGTSLSIAAISELPTMFLFSWFLKHFKCKSLMRTAALFFTLKAILILLSDRIWMIDVAQLLQMLAFALYTAASVYYTNQIIPKKDQVKGQAMMTTANTVGGVLGSFLGGQLLNYFSVPVTLTTGTVLSAIGTLIVFVAAEDGKYV